jgi:Asp-tRNA(Asn)/Glu-tRNA(Gln) amidotransferase A subunit family amidase
MTDPAMLTATEAARRIADGRLHPADLLAACQARTAAREGAVRAFAWYEPDAIAPPRAGRLHGLPIGVKDVLDTADMPTQYGSPIWAGHRPRADAAAVALARAAGAVVIGKTVTTEFAMRHPGPTTNPNDAARTPGGSSQGSAAGVAAGFFPLSFGTQTAGSIIRPAAFCGVVGYKPSFGTLPRHGLKMIAESLDTIGVMARSVADCALAVGTTARLDLGAPEENIGLAPRIGLCRGPGWAIAAPETHALWERLALRLSLAGARAPVLELPAEIIAADGAHSQVMQAEAAQGLGWERAHAAPLLSPGLRHVLADGADVDGARLIAARLVLAQARAAFSAALGTLDVLVTPAAPGEAPSGLDWTGDPSCNRLWTALHVPCVTVPAGEGPAGLPLGIQIVGRCGDDARVLAAAAWVAAAVG